MTVEQFNCLPVLLRRQLVMDLTGMSSRKLKVLVEDGVLRGRRFGSEFKYYRESVREMAGLKGNGNGK